MITSIAGLTISNTHVAGNYTRVSLGTTSITLKAGDTYLVAASSPIVTTSVTGDWALGIDIINSSGTLAERVIACTHSGDWSSRGVPVTGMGFYTTTLTGKYTMRLFVQVGSSGGATMRIDSPVGIMLKMGA